MTTKTVTGIIEDVDFQDSRESYERSVGVEEMGGE